MASKRSLMAFGAVVFLLPSCTLVHVAKRSDSGETHSSSSSKKAKSSLISSKKTSSSSHFISSYEPWIGPTHDASSSTYVHNEMSWETSEVNEVDDQSRYEIRYETHSLQQAIVFNSNSFVEASEEFDMRPANEDEHPGAFKPRSDGMWMEYRFTLSKEQAEKFNDLPLVIYGGFDDTLSNDGSRYPSCFEAIVNGVPIEPFDKRSYFELELVPLGSSQTFIYFHPGINVPLVEGLNTFRYIRNGSGGLYLEEFWITDYVFAMQPYL
ncbi:MAG: hypothetical protein K6B51_00755 [Bacilli bacterium]|nr:hypothetical protein [Bacilli bacterium]